VAITLVRIKWLAQFASYNAAEVSYIDHITGVALQTAGIGTLLDAVPANTPVVKGVTPKHTAQLARQVAGAAIGSETDRAFVSGAEAAIQ
jgi:hypothetical protein